MLRWVHFIPYYRNNSLTMDTEATEIRRNIYELITIAPNLTDTEASQALERISKIIEDAECLVPSASKTSMRTRFAYPIKHVRQGLYHFIRFEAEPQKIKDLIKELKLVPEILRFRVEKIKLPREMPSSPIASPPARERGWTTREKTDLPATPILEEKKVTIEELDKKLEEILKEE